MLHLGWSPPRTLFPFPETHQLYLVGWTSSDLKTPEFVHNPEFSQSIKPGTVSPCVTLQPDILFQPEMSRLRSKTPSKYCFLVTLRLTCYRGGCNRLRSSSSRTYRHSCVGSHCAATPGWSLSLPIKSIMKCNVTDQWEWQFHSVSPTDLTDVETSEKSWNKWCMLTLLI